MTLDLQLYYDGRIIKEGTTQTLYMKVPFKIELHDMAA